MKTLNLYKIKSDADILFENEMLEIWGGKDSDSSGTACGTCCQYALGGKNHIIEE
jgi:hypothetical protein